MHLRCPHCRAPIPERAARCPVCGGDPQTLPAADAAPAALAPKYVVPSGAAPSRSSGMWWRAALALALVAVVTLALVGAGALLAGAGAGAVGWPALGGLAFALVAGALALVERQRARLVAAAAPTAPPLATGAGADLALLYLYAGHFAAPADRRAGLRAPLTRARVNAEDLAWRAIAATLTALADADVVELEEHALATPSGAVQAVAVRLVRPLPPGETFAARLLRPLVRRGVGDSNTVGEVTSQLVMARRPAAEVVALAREQALARGYLRIPSVGASGGFARGWLAAALLLPARVDPAHLPEAAPALAALDERLVAWDAREPTLVAALRAEIRAAFRRARARASHGAG
ncbi:MAG TPA: zinc ribbon domain-containing protein [Ktedonobacterales bacterium]|nr:zinc ribbon domain-containing protein [Ktedonobacterales bacterium]